MSVMSYNNVYLPYANITRFEQQAVGDEVSDTDWSLMKFDITAEFVISSEYLPMMIPDLVNVGNPVTNIADAVTIIRTRLLKRRKALSVKFNGKELIPANAALVSVDAHNGPKPISCTPIRLNNKSFLMLYHIQANYWDNLNVQPGKPPFPVGSNVLYNRWAETADIDELQYTTRSRDGKFVIASNNTVGNLADEVRSQMAVVGVPIGCLRKSSRYTVDPSGLGISYSIVDREVFKMPPSPAFQAEGEYTETSALEGGYNRVAEVRVALKADKLSDQGLLLRTAMAVCSTKLAINGAPLGALNADPQQAAILQSCGIRVALYDNAVEVNMRALILPTKARTRGVALKGSIYTPFSDGVAQTPPLYKPRGSMGLLLQAAAYYDPSIGAALDPVSGQMQPGVEPGKAITVPSGVA